MKHTYNFGEKQQLSSSKGRRVFDLVARIVDVSYQEDCGLKPCIRRATVYGKSFRSWE
jgi:hypothetical protein